MCAPIDTRQAARVGERDQLAKPGIVPSVRQISLGALKKGEESALGIVECRSHRDSLPPEAGCGDGDGKTLRSHAFGGEVSEAGVHELASREAQRLKARRPKAVTDPTRRRTTPSYPPSILREHGLGATAPPHATVPSKRCRDTRRHCTGAPNTPSARRSVRRRSPEHHHRVGQQEH